MTFVSGTHVFSSAAFKEAVAEADVDVVSLEIDVCGPVDDQNVLRSSANGQQRIVRLRGVDRRGGRTTCVTGRLDERTELPELEVTKLLQ